MPSRRNMSPVAAASLRRVHQPAVDDLDAFGAQPIHDDGLVFKQPLLEAVELIPIEPAAAAKEADLGAAVVALEEFVQCRSCVRSSSTCKYPADRECLGKAQPMFFQDVPVAGIAGSRYAFHPDRPRDRSVALR